MPPLAIKDITVPPTIFKPQNNNSVNYNLIKPFSGRVERFCIYNKHSV